MTEGPLKNSLAKYTQMFSLIVPVIVNQILVT
ncbi:hypothetical protein M0802_016023 [Mischocyttarus mexicanus]|nr:hypothetical protein M0802_016023 [Mischocyttarus mexicanus]